MAIFLACDFEVVIARWTASSKDANVVAVGSGGVMNSKPCFEAYATEYMAARCCDQDIFQFD